MDSFVKLKKTKYLIRSQKRVQLFELYPTFNRLQGRQIKKFTLKEAYKSYFITRPRKANEREKKKGYY